MKLGDINGFNRAFRSVQLPKCIGAFALAVVRNKILIGHHWIAALLPDRHCPLVVPRTYSAVSDMSRKLLPTQGCPPGAQ